MKYFFTNEWTISIISGILVFLITNTFINFQDKKHKRKQIFDANTMLLNHLRGYVVDNGIPPREIINAVKASIAREYNIKYDELLSIKSICEELVKDIIGNTYISNDSQKKYIDMLQNYLKQNDELENENKPLPTSLSKSEKRVYERISIIISIIASIATIVGSLLAMIN